MYLIDTNVLSAVRRRDRAPAGLARWIEATAPTEIYLSTVTVMEIEIGSLRIARKDSAQAQLLRAWLHDEVLPAFGDRIIPFDTAIALRCASLQVLDPKATLDAMIAATALEHDLTVVTRNTRHFVGMGVRLLNPWESNAQ
jgi:predicted nucleic acid-binding protein